MPPVPEALTSAQLEALRQQLEQLRESLQMVLRDSTGMNDVVTLDQSAVGRLSRMDAMQQQQMAAAVKRRSEARLDRIEAAIERLEADPEEFGWCPDCGEPIGFPRLNALPESVLCVRCLQARGL